MPIEPINPSKKVGDGKSDKYTKDKPDNFKKGGMASKRADGCCIKGKTKGRIV